MKISEIINFVDDIKPNAFSSAKKTVWLNEVEGMVQTDVMLLAPSSIITYVYESTWSGNIYFPDTATMVCDSAPGFHVGGTVTISELMDDTVANNIEAKILAVSSDGLTLTFVEGTFLEAETPAAAVLTFDGSSAEMLVRAAHHKIYYTYLMAMIDFANGEYAKYQNTMTMFNSTFVNFSTWFRETYHPADGEAEELGYYLSAYAIAVKHGYVGTEEEWLASLQGDRAESTEEAQAAAAAAAVYAATATDKATESAESATNVLTSATAANAAQAAAQMAQFSAETAEGNAATSATNAANSAANAATLETSTTNSAAMATTQATAAENSASSAAASATNAVSSASAAATSAANAASSAFAAAISATEAQVNYHVDGDRVGFKKGDESAYTYTDHLTGLQGEQGIQGDQGIQGIQGIQGEIGETGNGIASVVRTSGDGSPGTADTYTITMTSGATATFTVYNGADAGITVDSVMSATSTNPVQNKIVKAAIDGKADTSSLASVATSGIYSDLTGKPNSLSVFTDDLGSSPIHTHAQYITDVSDKADLVDGTVPAAQLPSYVDDVLEVAAYASLPGTGESGKIYITLDTNKTYRWSGSGYTEISESLALGEISSTAYRGDRGATAYNHSQATGNPHNMTKSDVGLGNVDNTADLNKPISTAEQSALNGKQNNITNTSNELFYGSGTTGILNQLAFPTQAGSVLRQDMGSAPYWTSLSSLVTAMKESLVDTIYPIGSLYMSVSLTSPATLFGGTWVQIKGRFLLGAGPNEVNTSDYWGSMPVAGQVNCAVNDLGGEPLHQLTTAEMPAHAHTMNDHLGYAETSEITRYTAGWGNVRVDTGIRTDYTGSGYYHNNMPPYLVVYMWKRTV